ncbi:hypothetical protein CBF_1027 [Clostridium botulinum F str. 230613]|uniref:Uncharacterized protein n=1 Tax=Clostridium botulinum (strain Langeland / NCTC 10281 / Type F) TaxID=441772 RepID=A7GC13_CLOBL|nr:hypothetical protein CLI_1057 [Clostridium botulinum F str. Langeland]ADF98791.1 hypothetical protein CBF_1027 [Clostridium botulinum F str. 230613]
MKSYILSKNKFKSFIQDSAFKTIKIKSDFKENKYLEK